MPDSPLVDRVRLVGLRESPLSVGEVLEAVADPAAGGTAVFVGSVRDEDGGRPVARLAYSAHPGAADQLARVAAESARTPGVVAVAAVHRLGDLAVGDLAVVVAVACGHRGPAFDVGRALIDAVKHEVPIWKHQTFADGSEEWVGAEC